MHVYLDSVAGGISSSLSHSPKPNVSPWWSSSFICWLLSSARLNFATVGNRYVGLRGGLCRWLLLPLNLITWLCGGERSFPVLLLTCFLSPPRLSLWPADAPLSRWTMVAMCVSRLICSSIALKCGLTGLLMVGLLTVELSELWGLLITGLALSPNRPPFLSLGDRTPCFCMQNGKYENVIPTGNLAHGRQLRQMSTSR